jgi:hypothetical protein
LKTLTSTEKVYQTQPVFNQQLFSKTFSQKINTTWHVLPKVWEEIHVGLEGASTAAIQF